MKINISKFCLWLTLLTFLGAHPASAQEPDRQLIVERIKILGARKTKPEVIQRYLSFREGDAFTPELMERAQENLLATNFFKSVDFSAEPGSEKGKIIVVIEVQERRLPTLEFAGGYSELDGWYVSPIGVRYDNLWGTGHFIGLRAIIGDRVGGFTFRFRQPNIFSSRMNFLLDWEALGRNMIHYFDGRQTIHKVNSGSLRLGLSGSRGVGKFLSGGYQAISAEPDSFAKFPYNDSTTQSFPPAIAQQLGKKQMGIFWLRLQADTRDNGFYPRQGFWGALSVEKADPKFGGDTQFTRAIIDGRFYQPLGSSVLALRLKAGRTSGATPYYERFYLGGAYSLRGYAERSLTPLAYGTELFLGNVEWRILIASRDPQKPNLVGVIFFDTGSIGAPATGSAGDEIFTAVGFGFRLKVPVIGWLRCDFAYPEKQPDDFRFHLAIGHLF